MNFSNSKGGKLITGIAVYSVAKCILNMILGGFSLSSLLLALAFAAFLFVPVKYVNYIAAAILAFIAVSHLPANISNISSNWIYLAEGVIDIICAVLLVTNSDIKENYSKDIKIS